MKEQEGTDPAGPALASTMAGTSGAWRFFQRDAEGNEFAFHSMYPEVTLPERIVDTFEFEGIPGHVILETAIFEEHEGRTKVVGSLPSRRLRIATGCPSRGWRRGDREHRTPCETPEKDGRQGRKGTGKAG